MRPQREGLREEKEGGFSGDKKTSKVFLERVKKISTFADPKRGVIETLRNNHPQRQIEKEESQVATTEARLKKFRKLNERKSKVHQPQRPETIKGPLRQQAEKVLKR